jgi:hypothetical protein
MMFSPSNSGIARLSAISQQHGRAAESGERCGSSGIGANAYPNP